MSENTQRPERLELLEGFASVTEPIIEVESEINVKPATKENPVQFLVSTRVRAILRPSHMTLVDLKTAQGQTDFAEVLAAFEGRLHAARAIRLEAEVMRRKAVVHGADLGESPV